MCVVSVCTHVHVWFVYVVCDVCVVCVVVYVCDLCICVVYVCVLCGLRYPLCVATLGVVITTRKSEQPPVSRADV